MQLHTVSDEMRRRWWQGARTVPHVRWRASHTWRPTPTGAIVLPIGLCVFGAGEALVLQSRIGNSPWTVLAEGVSRQAGTNIGLATFCISAAVLLGWWPLQERPGLGTVANVVIVAAALDTTALLVPAASNVTAGLAYAVAGTLLVGLGSGLYLTTGLGPGPRDGLMTSLHRRSGWPVARIRLLIEVMVLSIGALLGGRVGIGTVIFALLVPRTVAWGLALVARAAE